VNLYPIIKTLLFQLDAEKAHHLTLKALNRSAPLLPYLSKIIGTPGKSKTVKPLSLMGLEFANPVGLAAGLDKNAEAVDALAALGFGFIETGTVTPKPQPGNPLPRLFRIPGDQALINRMGFNNMGADVAASRLSKRKTNIPVGANIGKNKDTPNELAHKDYEFCFRVMHDTADYFVVNVSSPNTGGLRALQEAESLRKILSGVQEINHGKAKQKPILLKIAPELNEHELRDVVSLCIETKLDGILATNTTTDRNLESISVSDIEKLGNGGLSGAPLKQKSLQTLIHLEQIIAEQDARNKLCLISSGGIMSASDALERKRRGAAMVQLYTGFVYHGPKLIADILSCWYSNPTD
jgi:dihydroorotate dehydrogenase